MPMRFWDAESDAGDIPDADAIWDAESDAGDIPDADVDTTYDGAERDAEAEVVLDAECPETKPADLSPCSPAQDECMYGFGFCEPIPEHPEFFCYCDDDIGNFWICSRFSCADLRVRPGFRRRTGSHFWRTVGTAIDDLHQQLIGFILNLVHRDDSVGVL